MAKNHRGSRKLRCPNCGHEWEWKFDVVTDVEGAYVDPDEDDMCPNCEQAYGKQA